MEAHFNYHWKTAADTHRYKLSLLPTRTWAPPTLPCSVDFPECLSGKVYRDKITPFRSSPHFQSITISSEK